MTKQAWKTILVGGPVVLAGLLYLVEAMFFYVPTGDVFSRAEFPDSSYFLYDLGVTDVNNDDVLDIFTSNHFALHHVMLGDGAGGFSDSLASLQLYQDIDFPEIEDMRDAAAPGNEGVYIFWRDDRLNVTNHNASTESAVKGQLFLYSDVNITSISGTSAEAAKLDVQSEETSSGATKTLVKFSLESGEALQVEPELKAIPIKVAIDEHYDLSKLFLGPRHIVPRSHAFEIFLRDRHGMAWADFTGDGLLDLFIVRGGLKGNMLQQPDEDSFKDELLVNAGGYFEDITSNSNLKKRGCSGHQVAWVDVDNNDKLDLYITCRRSGQPNQLYMQTEEYVFEDIAEELDLNNQGDWLGPFLWQDYDQDQDQDLILEENKKLWLYVNEANSYTRRLIASHEGGISKLTAADFDSDGDLDIYAASSKQSLLLVNDGGSLLATDPARLNLPLRAESANWVDYDNDGLMDLHVVPGGIYRQRSDGVFEKTGLLEFLFHHYAVEDARATWFDLDNDGDRDVIMAIKYKASPLETLYSRVTGSREYKKGWKLFLYKNGHKGNNWLQMNLTGPKGNRPAIGARVMLQSQDGTVTQQVIGHAEGSHSSQGHYRLYFGLGNHGEPSSIQVIWPDGKVQTVEPAVDQLLGIDYEE